MYEQRGQRRAWKTMYTYSPLLLHNGNHVYSFPQYVKISFQRYILHSFCIVYQGGYPQEQYYIGSRYTWITFRISVQKKLWCLLFRELEILPAQMYILRMALLIHDIIQVLNRADLKFFKSVNKAKKKFKLQLFDYFLNWCFIFCSQTE